MVNRVSEDQKLCWNCTIGWVGGWVGDVVVVVVVVLLLLLLGCIDHTFLLRHLCCYMEVRQWTDERRKFMHMFERLVPSFAISFSLGVMFSLQQQQQRSA